MNRIDSRTARRNNTVTATIVALTLAIAGAGSLAEPYETDPDLTARDADAAAGKQAMEKKDWREAVERFSQVAVRNPDHADLHNYLGFSYRNLKQFDLAFKHYKRAIAIDPRHLGAHEYIGEAYLMVGDLASAEKHLAALREICLLPCEELKDLEKAVTAYRAQPGLR